MCVSLSPSLSRLCNSLSHLGGCPFNRPLHIGHRTSPLPRVWCPHTVPVLRLDGRSGCNWQDPRLALCGRPSPCRLIGTASGQRWGHGYGRASIDGWIVVSGKLLSDETACTVNLPPQPHRAARACVFMYMFILVCSKHSK